MDQALLYMGLTLGSLLVGAGQAYLISRASFLAGFQLGRDDRALDAGDTGSLEAIAEEAVGEESGRHAKLPWPVSADTERFEAVPHAQ